MLGVTKKIAIIVTVIILVLGAAGYVWYRQNAASGAEDYLDARRTALSELSKLEISSIVAASASIDVISESNSKQLKEACDQATKIGDNLPSEVASPNNEDVKAAESKYPLEDIREDAAQYADVCRYYHRDADVSRQVEEARTTSEYKSLLLKDCDASADCYDPSKKDEFIAYYKQNIIKPVEEKVTYYAEKSCPFTIDGGEQFCNALTNYFRSEAAYYRVYISQVEKDRAQEGNKQVAQALDAWNDSYDSLERLALMLQKDGPNGVFIDQLKELEDGFSKKT